MQPQEESPNQESTEMLITQAQLSTQTQTTGNRRYNLNQEVIQSVMMQVPTMGLEDHC